MLSPTEFSIGQYTAVYAIVIAFRKCSEVQDCVREELVSSSRWARDQHNSLFYNQDTNRKVTKLLSNWCFYRNTPTKLKEHFH